MKKTVTGKKKEEGVKSGLLRNAFGVLFPNVPCSCKNSQSIYNPDDVFVMKRGFCFSDVPLSLAPSSSCDIKWPRILSICGKTPTDGIEANDSQFLLCFRDDNKHFKAFAVVEFSVTLLSEETKKLDFLAVHFEKETITAFLEEMKSLTGGASKGKKRSAETLYEPTPKVQHVEAAPVDSMTQPASYVPPPPCCPGSESEFSTPSSVPNTLDSEMSEMSEFDQYPVMDTEVNLLDYADDITLKDDSVLLLPLGVEEQGEDPMFPMKNPGGFFFNNPDNNGDYDGGMFLDDDSESSR